MADFKVIIRGLEVYICLSQNLSNSKGDILLTDSMSSDVAIDANVEFLVHGIKKAGKHAKKKLAKITEESRKRGLHPKNNSSFTEKT